MHGMATVPALYHLINCAGNTLILPVIENVSDPTLFVTSLAWKTARSCHVELSDENCTVSLSEAEPLPCVRQTEKSTWVWPSTDIGLRAFASPVAQEPDGMEAVLNT